MFYDVVYYLGVDSDVVDSLRGFTYDKFTFLVLWFDCVVVDDDDEVVFGDVVEHGGADLEGDVGHEWEGAQYLVVRYVLAIDGYLDGLGGEEVYTCFDADGIGYHLDAFKSAEGESELDCVFDVVQDDWLSVDDFDGVVDVAGGIDVNVFGL